MKPLDKQLATEMIRLIQSAYGQFGAGAGVELTDGWQQTEYLWASDYPGMPPVAIGFIARKGDVAAAVLRGTADIWEWMADVFAAQRPAKMRGGSFAVHAGFAGLYDSMHVGTAAISGTAASCLRLANAASIVITGHSLGAALATLLAADLADLGPQLVTFGSPRVGSPEFAEAFTQFVPDAWRVANIDDIVTHAPPAHLIGSPLRFDHVGQLVSFDAGPPGLNPTAIRGRHSIDTYAKAVEAMEVPVMEAIGV